MRSPREDNRVVAKMGVSSSDQTTPVNIKVNPVNGALYTRVRGGSTTAASIPSTAARDNNNVTVIIAEDQVGSGTSCITVTSDGEVMADVELPPEIIEIPGPDT